MADTVLQPRYLTSHALIIGINAYAVASPLACAVSDAEAVAAILKERFAFKEEHVHLLRDSEATRDAILRRFLSFSREGMGVNDRVLVFFAGHGLTMSSRRGEVGFLVPHEGDPRELASLIRWDELTRNADLLPAKHIMFLMDACYGGLAITRTLQPGSMRFIKDMLLRPARQVLTAGKADEAVSDRGGPLPGHSVFTGYLLEGMSGKAADKEGIITANGLMAYVYRKVGGDPGSQQTPHFGYLEGDGDFVFAAPMLERLQEDVQQDQDALASVPAVYVEPSGEQSMTVAENVKELLSEDRHRLALYDLTAREVREVLSQTSEDYFPIGNTWSPPEFAERLGRYEEVTKSIREIAVLCGRWGSAPHESSLILPIKRLSDRLGPRAGLSLWIALRWYPILLQLYSGGIAAVAGENYQGLKALLHVPVDADQRSDRGSSILRATWSEIGETKDAFKTLPGHEHNHVPLSEYLFKLLQPTIDDLLYVGREYESHFDRFEVLMSVEHADQLNKETGRDPWGPYGRFAWKVRRPGFRSPLQELLSEAEARGNAWLPAKAGLFEGSADRFIWLASQYKGLGSL